MLDSLSTALAGRYTIEGELGAGGMATVYLAHDVKHDRKVALKVLRPELAAVIGAERFLAEIKTTANLQHPHILPLHDSGEVDGTVFYVMPFVEGESLRDRLNHEKQLPVGDAVPIATEVAGALDYAHRQGIIHRDIKPENILLHDGRALVADFGIALAASSAAGTRMTETGMSLGTPHYMSPEQAMGERDLDARSDIYALGCILHEMLSGEPPFTGPTAQAIVAKVLTDDPAPISKLRRTVPSHLEDTILTALEKLPADRFASAADFASAMQDEGGRGGMRNARSRARDRVSRRRVLWPIGFAAVTTLALWGWLRPSTSPLEQPPSRLAVILPNLGGASTSLQRQLALTPDGSALLYTAIAPDGENRTMRRDLDEPQSTVVPGVVPFLSGYVISQDGREFIGSDAADQQMYRYPITGRNLTRLPPEAGGTSLAAWDAAGTLWLTVPTNDRGMVRLESDGNVTYPLGSGTAGLVMMQILPGDRTALVTRAPVGTSSGVAFLLDLQSGNTTLLVDESVVEIRYTAGHLVYVLQDGTMQAVPFDPSTLRVTGAPVTLAQGVALTGTSIAQFAVAANGTVAYIPEEPRDLVFVDRSGAVRPATTENRNFHAPLFSPDGQRVSVDFNTADGRDVWLLSVDDGVLTRATFDRDGHDATWSPDGETLIYTSFLTDTVGTYRTRPGSDDTELLFSSLQLGYTGLWLSDESALVTTGNALTANGFADIGIVRNGGRGPIEPLVATRFVEQFPALSPDDRWIAYSSRQSGRDEVYVRGLEGGDPVQVSQSGGIEPAWGGDGRELFYRTGAGGGSHMAVAAVQADPVFTVTSRQTLFSVADMATATPHTNYGVSPDGRTFVMVRFNPLSRIMVIQNLPALVRKLSGRRYH
jgi:serine/threonine-protein kinase